MTPRSWIWAVPPALSRKWPKSVNYRVMAHHSGSLREAAGRCVAGESKGHSQDLTASSGSICSLNLHRDSDWPRQKDSIASGNHLGSMYLLRVTSGSPALPSGHSDASVTSMKPHVKI
jgi:hypothetical protein